MAILQKQKEMFYWNNVNIRQKCGRLIKAKSLSFSNNADTETEVFHWLKTKTKCQISVPSERNKTDTDNCSAQISKLKLTLLLTFFSRETSCFVKLKIVSMTERVKRWWTHRFSDIAHISPRISISLQWTMISTLVFFEERFEVLFFHSQTKGKSYRGQISTIDYNRYRSVKRVSEPTFSPALSFSRAFMCW